MQRLDRLLDTLRRKPNVVGLVEYGSRRANDSHPAGDYDLFIVLQELDRPVESLHFHLGELPLDLNLRTIAQLQRMEYLAGIDRALLEGRILYDPSGIITAELSRLRRCSLSVQPALGEHGQAVIRHGHTHVLHKLAGRTTERPLWAELLLSANLYWLLENYFRVRQRPFFGEKQALDELQRDDPDLVALIVAFYATSDLERRISITTELSERVLQPIGGLWRTDEVLSFGDTDYAGLQEDGRRILTTLLADVQG